MEELRRTTLSKGAVSLGLSVMILYSLFDIKAVAKDTISRLPASLVMGASESPVKSPSIFKLQVSCSELPGASPIDVKSELLQVHFRDCGTNGPIEVLNRTNGYEATLFESLDSTTSDLIALEKGANDLRIRFKKEASTLSLKVNLSL